VQAGIKRRAQRSTVRTIWIEKVSGGQFRPVG